MTRIVGSIVTSILGAFVVAAARSTSQAALMNWISLAISFLALAIAGFALFKVKRDQVDPTAKRVQELVQSEAPAVPDR